MEEFLVCLLIPMGLRRRSFERAVLNLNVILTFNFLTWT